MSDFDIKEIRSRLGLTQEEFAEKLSVSIRTVQNWEKGSVIPKTKHEILRTLSCPAEESAFVGRGWVSEVIPVPEENYMMVEYADLRASAGQWGCGPIDVLPETHRRLVPREYERGNYLVVRVDGDSMNDGTSRSLVDGDEVLVKEFTDNLSFGLPNMKKCLFVITSREGNFIKQIKEVNLKEGYLLCHSFNPEPRYADFKLSLEDVGKIFQVCKIVSKQISLI